MNIDNHFYEITRNFKRSRLYTKYDGKQTKFLIIKDLISDERITENGLGHYFRSELML